MKKLLPFLIFIAFATSAFAMHKFYVAIFQVNYVSERKMLQITSRIFVDDLNEALKLKHKRTFMFEQDKIPEADFKALSLYYADKFKVTVNNKPQTINVLSCEMESNVLICYISVRDVPKIKTLQVKNEMLTEYVTEQQNIIQTNIYGQKKNLLLTAESPSGKVNF
ncbi:MAG: hypothetical protein IR153_04470 [Flavobacterium sp.]|nr:hypothetical protein [Flavobacterium sp.]